jgi:hypothetical protein
VPSPLAQATGTEAVGSGVGFADVNFPTFGSTLTLTDLSLPGFTGAAGQSWSLSSGTQNFSPANLPVANGLTAVLYLTASLTGSGPLTIGTSTGGLTFDVCASGSQVPASGTYTFTYALNGALLGSVGSATVASADGTCPSNTHVAGPVTPLGGTTIKVGDTIGITISH